MQIFVIYYQVLRLERDSFETCSSAIIYEIMVHLLAIEQNN